MKVIEQAQAIHVIGIELCTSNQEAMRTIPPHWQRFTQEGVLARVPGRIGDEVFAVYTNFENAGSDNHGIYSLVLGAAVPPGTPVPPGMVRAVAPAGRRAVFPVEKGRFDKVGEAWQAVWARGDLPKSYVADYERYGSDGSIEILVGLHPDAPAR